MQILKWVTFALCFVLAFGVHGQQATNSEKLSVKISNIQNKSKTLYVGLYRAVDEFPEFSKYWKNLKVTTMGSEVLVEFEVPYGYYAVAVSHDLNSNGRLDKNFFGYPSEPFGFSNNFKPKLSSPDFSNCKFAFSQSNNSINIILID
ncbi:MAG: DUF2141 domain-containing protein [Chryseotalea sp.]|jgi:uncharacterized protein (DUF2141 family)